MSNGNLAIKAAAYVLGNVIATTLVARELQKTDLSKKTYSGLFQKALLFCFSCTPSMAIFQVMKINPLLGIPMGLLSMVVANAFYPLKKMEETKNEEVKKTNLPTLQKKIQPCLTSPLQGKPAVVNWLRPERREGDLG